MLSGCRVHVNVYGFSISFCFPKEIKMISRGDKVMILLTVTHISLSTCVWTESQVQILFDAKHAITCLPGLVWISQLFAYLAMDSDHA